MAKLMSIDQLLKATAAIGIHLEDADYDTANLYVMVDPDGINLYIGKAASKRRHLEEDNWKELDYEQKIVSGYPVLMVENDACRRPLLYTPENFRGTKLRDHIVKHKWGGDAIDTVLNRLNNETPPTVEEVEKILVRTHIRTGRLIGNSQFASQWETPIGTYSDTVAALVADAARTLGIIPQKTDKGTEITDEPENDSDSDQT
ncbi:hypothetical protein [Brevibacterium aurantiacum]|uniref:Uncharacterized protein n=1 Tax=Brevibacterium aurantiacum TaxID=273384 RepID=A0A2A3Z2Z6_BREAU|nr:hypothetical protein [Brevibacterium aurantiacum]PCC45863.1 hypothetical protein CIK64_14160 [Brevibacterium aurantiacum]